MLKIIKLLSSVSVLFCHISTLTANGIKNTPKGEKFSKSNNMNTSYPELYGNGHFHGNSSEENYFKFLHQDGTYVLIGARNVIYNLSLSRLTEAEEKVRQTTKSLFGLQKLAKNQKKVLEFRICNLCTEINIYFLHTSIYTMRRPILVCFLSET